MNEKAPIPPPSPPQIKEKSPPKLTGNKRPRSEVIRPDDVQLDTGAYKQAKIELKETEDAKDLQMK